MPTHTTLKYLILFLINISLAYADRPSYRGPEISSIVISPQNSNIMYVGTRDGVFKSIDRGLTWKFSDSIVLKKPEDSGMTRQQIEGACGKLVVAPSSPNILYTICWSDSNSGGHSTFKKSIDYGKTWDQFGEGLPQSWFAPALAVDPNNSNVVFASWANGGLYRSMDGGKSWKESDQGLIDTKHESFLGYLMQPPLHQAVMDQDIKRVRKLLKNGENVNEVSSTGMTPMLLVARGSNSAMFKLLRSYGAMINVRDKEGNFPIHIAVLRNNIAILKELLKAGADVNERNDRNSNTHNTPLTMSISKLDKPLMDLLIEKGADLTDPNVMGAAVESKLLALVTLLYEKGAALNFENGVGNLVDYAGWLHQPDIVIFFLEKGLKPRSEKYSNPYFRPRAWSPERRGE